MEYRVQVSPLMRSINDILTKECENMSRSVLSFNKGNVVVEVPKHDLDSVIAALSRHYPDVVDIRKTYLMIEHLHDFILVKPLISEAPLISDDSVPVPSVEKLLVDSVSDKEYTSISVSQRKLLFQHAFEQYEINTSRMLRYAARKGKREEVETLLAGLDQNRISIVISLCKVLATAPVQKAWLFGSFARMEEKPDSDIDLLVSMDGSAPVGLIAFSSLVEELERASGRRVDLIAEGSLKPFAAESVNRDKYLVYERAAA